MSAAPRNARVGHASGSMATPAIADAPLLRRARTVPASGTAAAPAVSASSRALSVIDLRSARLNPALAGLSTESEPLPPSTGVVGMQLTPLNLLREEVAHPLTTCGPPMPDGVASRC